jgi:hypothetical protein
MECGSKTRAVCRRVAVKSAIWRDTPQQSSVIGVSESYATDIRAGRRRLNPRHWQALGKLAGCRPMCTQLEGARRRLPDCLSYSRP